MKEIIDKIVEILEKNTSFKTINSFDESEEIELNGVLAVNAGSITFLNHGNCHDFQLTVNISGMFLTDQDKNQRKIQEMFATVFDFLTKNDLKKMIPNCAGCFQNSGNCGSDGELNTFVLTIDLLINQD